MKVNEIPLVNKNITGIKYPVKIIVSFKMKGNGTAFTLKYDCHHCLAKWK